MIYACEICGREFNRIKGRQVTCSPECSAERNRRKTRERKMAKKREKERKMSLAEEARVAREHGMSYGQWQAIKWKEEHRLK